MYRSGFFASKPNQIRTPIEPNRTEPNRTEPNRTEPIIIIVISIFVLFICIDRKPIVKAISLVIDNFHNTYSFFIIILLDDFTQYYATINIKHYNFQSAMFMLNWFSAQASTHVTFHP